MYGLLYQFGWLIYAVVMIGMCNISMVLTLNQLRVHMSAATRRMHFRFLRMIALQVCLTEQRRRTVLDDGSHRLARGAYGVCDDDYHRRHPLP